MNFNRCLTVSSMAEINLGGISLKKVLLLIWVSSCLLLVTGSGNNISREEYLKLKRRLKSLNKPAVKTIKVWLLPTPVPSLLESQLKTWLTSHEKKSIIPSSSIPFHKVLLVYHCRSTTDHVEIMWPLNSLTDHSIGSSICKSENDVEVAKLDPP